MNAIIIAIGNELICGQTIETNSSHLALRLGEMGIEADEHWTVGDGREAIAHAIRAAAGRADLVLVTGGLGPTDDDRTRRGLAEAMGAPLVLDEQCLAGIEAFFKKRRRKMVAANRSQAMIPQGAEPLANSAGTAPGIAVKLDRAQVFFMPGVPHEMERMFDEQIAPRLPAGHGAIAHHVVHTFGRGESDTASAIRDLMSRRGPVSVGTTVAAGMVSIRITARGPDAAEADRLAAETMDEIRNRLGKLVIGAGTDATMPSAVGELLRTQGQTVSTAESCTGGLVGQLITSVPGSSDYYLGGFVCYANQAKQQMVGVPAELLQARGAVSEQVAEAMAAGCRQRTGSDWAIAVTGIAGPDGGTAEKPVGLVYTALAGPETTQSDRHIFGGNRDIIRLRAALTGLNYLRLQLME